MPAVPMTNQMVKVFKKKRKMLIGIYHEDDGSAYSLWYRKANSSGVVKVGKVRLTPNQFWGALFKHDVDNTDSHFRLLENHK